MTAIVPVGPIEHRETNIYRKLVAEAIGTGFLLATVVGSGIMAENLPAVTLSFANPAVTIARSLTDTFSGIAPSNVMLFIVAQIIGAVAATFVMGWLYETGRTKTIQSGD